MVEVTVTCEEEAHRLLFLPREQWLWGQVLTSYPGRSQSQHER